MINQTRSETIPIEKLVSLSTEIYHEGDSFPSVTLKKVPWLKKLLNERQLKKMINKLFKELDPYLPELKAQSEELTDLSSPVIAEVKQRLLTFMYEIDEKKLLFDEPFLSFFISEGYMDVAEEFILRAKKEDQQLDDSEIFQAMRNSWIMNSLQLYWGIPLQLTTPMYAYSMLYPYTDNLLDDPDVTAETKRLFNLKLAEALTGKTIPSSTPSETRVFELVKQILTDFPVETFPGVTESIQLIHDAQIKSMKQTSELKLTEEQILQISLFKGGTSVLADAYLIKGTLDEEEMVFAFHYGAFLQLLDDLQDKETDKRENNQTLFSTDQTPEVLEKSIRKLLSYIFTVNKKQKTDDPVKLRMKAIISRCTLMMVMESVGKNPGAVPPSLYKELESYSTIRLKTYKTLQKQIETIMKDIM